MPHRDWRQQLDPAIPMVFRRRVLWEGHHYDVGDALPETLVARRDKLWAMWENQWIEHAPAASEPGEASDAALVDPPAPAPAPEPEPDPAPEPEPERPRATLRRNRTWYYLTLPDGSEHKANGQKAFDALVERLGVQVV